MAPFLIHRIGLEAYGFFLFLFSLSNMLGVVNLGLGDAALRHVAFYHGRGDVDGINRVVSASFWLFLALSILVSVLLWPFAGTVSSLLKVTGLTHDAARVLVQLAIVGFLLRFVSGAFSAIPQGFLRYDVFSLLVVGESIVRVIGQVIVSCAEWGCTVCFCGMCICRALWTIAVVITARLLLPSLSIRLSLVRAGLAEVSGYSFFVFLSQIVGMAWQHADRLLLGFFVGAGSVALFAVPRS